MKINDIKHRWAVVTGASSGIGLSFSRCLARYGCNVLMVSNQPEALAQCAADIHLESGVETRTLMIDLSAQEAAECVLQAIAALPDIPLIFINNAGIFDFKCVSDLSPRRLQLYIDLHIRTFTLLTTAVGELMATRRKGYILNMSSMSCWMPMPGIAMYSATKAYVRAFSRAYRIEMLDRGVSVTVACPGGIDTGLFGLKMSLRRLAVSIGVITPPDKFAYRAIKRMLRGKAQYINGMINRISIVAAAAIPEWGRRWGKRKLLDR